MIFDLHNDVLTSGLVGVELDAWYSENVAQKRARRVVTAAWATELGFHSSKTVCSFYTHLKAKFGHTLFAVEDLGGLDCVDIIDFLPIIYASLTWNFSNRFAGGALDCGGLTGLGKNLLMRMEKRGILIDTAHLNRESFFDVERASSGRLICSHACCNELHMHPRNLTRDQLKVIAERDGVVGVCFVGSFLCEGRASSFDVARHIDYIASTIGIRYVAIGTDFFGTDNFPYDLKDYNYLPNLVEKLEKMGYNEKDIEMIFYKNASRVVE